jgi:hypothetical protein
MDNSVDLPGYKYYVEGSERPAVMVTFVNIVEAPGEFVDGAIVPFEERLDVRERNYTRREVEPGLWAYTGTDDARRRFDAGPSVVSREYLEIVRAAFPDVEDPGVPVRDLRRIDLG